MWKNYSFQAVTHLESILSQPECTLDDVLDEPDIIQECKSQNRLVIEFLSKPDILKKVLNYVVEPAPEGSDEKRRKKYPMICTEMLCSEVWQLTEAICADDDMMHALFGFLERDPKTLTESDLLVESNCARVASSLRQRRLFNAVEFLKKIPDCVRKFVDRVSSPNVVELLLKLVTGDTGSSAEAQATMQWFSDEHLVELLVDKFVESTDREEQESISLTFIEMVFFIGTQQAALNSTEPSPIISRLESQECVDKILTHSLQSDKQEVTLCGVEVLIELLRKRRLATYTDTRDPEQIPSLVRAVSKHLEECRDFLSKPPRMKTLDTTFGRLEPPLGLPRQSVLEMVEAFTLTNSAYAFDALLASGFMNPALDIFFQYPWNNFAHQSVYNIIATILPSTHIELSMHILKTCHLLERILKAEKESAEYQEKNHCVLGYIGHLTAISSVFNMLVAREPKFDELAKELPEWETYRTEILEKRAQAESQLLGGKRPPQQSSLDDEDPSMSHGMEHIMMHLPSVDNAFEIKDDDDDILGEGIVTDDSFPAHAFGEQDPFDTEDPPDWLKLGIVKLNEDGPDEYEGEEDILPASEGEEDDDDDEDESDDDDDDDEDDESDEDEDEDDEDDDDDDEDDEDEDESDESEEDDNVNGEGPISP